MSGLKRRRRWRGHLDAHVRAIWHEPFEWGRNDCALFVGGAVGAMCNTDLVTPFRGRYDSALGAMQFLRAMGLDDLAGLAARYGDPIPVAKAQIGDVVLVPGENAMPALGLVGGAHVLVRGERGLGPMDLMTATRAFAIGRDV